MTFRLQAEGKDAELAATTFCTDLHLNICKIKWDLVLSKSYIIRLPIGDCKMDFVRNPLKSKGTLHEWSKMKEKDREITVLGRFAS